MATTAVQADASRPTPIADILSTPPSTSRLKLYFATLTGRADPVVLTMVSEMFAGVDQMAAEVHLLCTSESIQAEAHRRADFLAVRIHTLGSAICERLEHCVSCPIDKEEFLQVVRSVDRAARALASFVDEVGLYRPESLHRAVQFARGIAELSAQLREATIAALRRDSDAGAELVRTQIVAMALRRLYHLQNADLIESEREPQQAMKINALLRTLDSARERLADATLALADGAVKHGL